MRAKLKHDVNDASVNEFLESEKDDSRRADCRQLVSLMSKLTGEPPKMWGTSIVGFGTYHYKYDSGREGECCLMGFSPRKQSLTVYGLMDWDRPEFEQLGKYTNSKCCLYVKRLSEIKLPILEKLLKLELRKMSKNRIWPSSDRKVRVLNT